MNQQNIWLTEPHKLAIENIVHTFIHRCMESKANKTSVLATVDLSEFDADCVKLMVEFMYSGEAKIPSVFKKAIDLVEVVNYY